MGRSWRPSAAALQSKARDLNDDALQSKARDLNDRALQSMARDLNDDALRSKARDPNDEALQSKARNLNDDALQSKARDLNDEGGREQIRRLKQQREQRKVHSERTPSAASGGVSTDNRGVASGDVNGALRTLEALKAMSKRTRKVGLIPVLAPSSPNVVILS